MADRRPSKSHLSPIAQHPTSSRTTSPNPTSPNDYLPPIPHFPNTSRETSPNPSIQRPASVASFQTQRQISPNPSTHRSASISSQVTLRQISPNPSVRPPSTTTSAKSKQNQLRNDRHFSLHSADPPKSENSTLTDNEDHHGNESESTITSSEYMPLLGSLERIRGRGNEEEGGEGGVEGGLCAGFYGERRKACLGQIGQWIVLSGVLLLLAIGACALGIALGFLVAWIYGGW